ncbi:tripartite tricarboxylate transporter TctB family protein [Paracoccus laeviglucosivorans]|uniref:tripartite tricarboxylate transporter TctB family protein n=1 Tax=Paracoccus laeviglucosivorans TaxID=1197861 RepID=UPI00163D63C2|nr:tripartite tricarboxylate transporter TctB family protein [Paracoccus laeviglucosivorans]
MGLLTLLGGVALFLASMQFSPLPGQKYGAETLPEVVAVMAIVLGLVMLVQGLRHESGMALVEITDWARDGGTWAKLAAATVLIAVYCVVLDRVGFTISSLVLVAIMLWLTRTRPILILPIAVVTVLVVQFAFGRMLLVPLPRGELLSLPW